MTTGTTKLSNLSPEALKRMSVAELEHLATNIRQFLMDGVSQTGGHIGANLGTVDLSVALHYVFESPKDRIIWDTGHQGYTHKIVTGRAHLFPTLNTYGGMNRFVTRTESVHDAIEASHAGTSLSIALGTALARRLKGDPSYAVAVIGDGALAEGMALEALNHIGAERGLRLVIILNDNGFAISPGFGALHNYLKTRKPGDAKPDTLFSSLGFEYIGPVDGHRMPDLVEALGRATKSQRIPVVHVKTVKGYGFSVTQTHPQGMHFSFPFDKETGQVRPGYATKGYQDAAAEVILQEMEQDERVVAITPSTLYATGLQPCFTRFPERCFDPGMEEQHAMTMTVGFALEGYKPVIFYQATFMQRAFDQLVHDVCFMNLPTLLLAVRSGFAGYDNPTHHGLYDFAYLRGLPNLRMLYPKDRSELQRMVQDNLRSLKGPTLVLMPYGPVMDVSDASKEPAERFAQAEVVEEGREGVIISIGPTYPEARRVWERLKREGRAWGLVNLRHLKPLPEEQLVGLIGRTSRVVTVEEAVLDGGVGSAIAALMLDHGLKAELLRVGVPCTFVEPGSHDELTKAYGLDAEGIFARMAKRWQLA